MAGNNKQRKLLPIVLDGYKPLRDVVFETLRDAIINELVVPFKYYGIRDQLVDYGLSKSEERKMIAQLANDEHIEFISAQIESHRGQGKLKALAFCRNVTHARMMCEAMGERYKTAYLTGRNDQINAPIQSSLPWHKCSPQLKPDIFWQIK